MKRTVAVLLLTFFATTASAETVAVLTSHDCDLYLRAKKNIDAFGCTSEKYLEKFHGYIYGFLSARAVYTGKDYLRGVDISAIDKTIDEQCNFRPKAGIVDIAEIIPPFRKIDSCCAVAIPQVAGS